MRFRLTALLIKEEKGYTSYCPELGVASQGETVEEALKNLKEAVKLYLETAKELGVLEEKVLTTNKEALPSIIEVEV